MFQDPICIEDVVAAYDRETVMAYLTADPSMERVSLVQSLRALETIVDLEMDLDDLQLPYAETVYDAYTEVREKADRIAESCPHDASVQTLQRKIILNSMKFTDAIFYKLRNEYRWQSGGRRDPYEEGWETEEYDTLITWGERAYELNEKLVELGNANGSPLPYAWVKPAFIDQCRLSARILALVHPHDDHDIVKSWVHETVESVRAYHRAYTHEQRPWSSFGMAYVRGIKSIHHIWKRRTEAGTLPLTEMCEIGEIAHPFYMEALGFATVEARKSGSFIAPSRPKWEDQRGRKRECSPQEALPLWFLSEEQLCRAIVVAAARPDIRNREVGILWATRDYDAEVQRIGLGIDQGKNLVLAYTRAGLKELDIYRLNPTPERKAGIQRSIEAALDLNREYPTLAKPTRRELGMIIDDLNA